MGMMETIVRTAFMSKYISPKSGKAGLKKVVERSKFLVVNYYRDLERGGVVELMNRIYNEVDFGIEYIEGLQIYSLVKATAKVPGDLAEVGTYQGGSAKLICESKGLRTLHLFDTFEGLPEVEKIDSPYFAQGAWHGEYENVKKYVSTYPNVHLYKGIFPATAGPVEDKKFSFVHLDVDLYESTLACLKFFYPRMSAGGLILSHDSWAPGVQKAFNEFFSDKSEPVLQLSGNQYLVSCH